MKKETIDRAKVEKLFVLFETFDLTFHEQFRTQFPEFTPEERIFFVQLLKREAQKTNTVLESHLNLAKAA